MGKLTINPNVLILVTVSKYPPIHSMLVSTMRLTRVDEDSQMVTNHQRCLYLNSATKQLLIPSVGYRTDKQII